MPDPINLRQVRKAKARTEQDRLAAQNRVTFGQSKAAKNLNEAKVDLYNRRLNQNLLDKPS